CELNSIKNGSAAFFAGFLFRPAVGLLPSTNVHVGAKSIPLYTAARTSNILPLSASLQMAYSFELNTASCADRASLAAFLLIPFVPSKSTNYQACATSFPLYKATRIWYAVVASLRFSHVA